MTGLYTKTSIGRHITKYLAVNQAQLGGFFIFDIDNFKQANDGNGHAFGDAAITEFAGAIPENFPKDSMIGQVGGDDLWLICLSQIPSEVEAQAEKISRALERTVVMDGKQWNMSASIGVAMSPNDGITYEMLYRNGVKHFIVPKRMERTVLPCTVNHLMLPPQISDDERNGGKYPCRRVRKADTMETGTFWNKHNDSEAAYQLYNTA